MKNHRDNMHHHELTASSNQPTSKYFTNNDCNEGACTDKKCHCECKDCNECNGNDCKDKKCDCGCKDCTCNAQPKGDCCD